MSSPSRKLQALYKSLVKLGRPLHSELPKYAKERYVPKYVWSYDARYVIYGDCAKNLQILPYRMDGLKMIIIRPEGYKKMFPDF